MFWASPPAAAGGGVCGLAGAAVGTAVGAGVVVGLFEVAAPFVRVTGASGVSVTGAIVCSACGSVVARVVTGLAAFAAGAVSVCGVPAAGALAGVGDVGWGGCADVWRVVAATRSDGSMAGPVGSIVGAATGLAV